LAQGTLLKLLETICNAISEEECETMDLTIELPGPQDNLQVPFSCGTVDLSALQSSTRYLSQLPEVIQNKNLNVLVPLHELLLTWNSNSSFKLAQSVACVLEVILRAKAGTLIQSQILSCDHIKVPYKKNRCRRLDAELRSKLAQMTHSEYKHFQLRLQRGRRRDSHQIGIPTQTPCLKDIAKREDTRLIQQYVGSMQSMFHMLKPHERNIWIAADAGTVGFESSLCSAAVLGGYDGPSCWLAPQAS
jgi:hypothetical protein